jgi:hypothetical protein
MELDTSEAHTYSFGLGVTAVPAPPALLAFLIFGLRGRRRSRSLRVN